MPATTAHNSLPWMLFFTACFAFFLRTDCGRHQHCLQLPSVNGCSVRKGDCCMPFSHSRRSAPTSSRGGRVAWSKKGIWSRWNGLDRQERACTSSDLQCSALSTVGDAHHQSLRATVPVASLAQAWRNSLSTWPTRYRRCCGH